MSAFLYGRLTRNRARTDPHADLRYLLGNASVLTLTGRGAGGDDQPPVIQEAPTAPVRQWQDALVALVPAEVLAVHAFALSLGSTTTSEADGSASTTITSPSEMRVVFVAMCILAAGVYLAGVQRVTSLDLARSILPALAFIFWTMITPNTAFDAWGLDLSPLVRNMIPVFGAIVVGVIAAKLASKADSEEPAKA